MKSRGGGQCCYLYELHLFVARFFFSEASGKNFSGGGETICVSLNSKFLIQDCQLQDDTSFLASEFREGTIKSFPESDLDAELY